MKQLTAACLPDPPSVTCRTRSRDLRGVREPLSGTGAHRQAAPTGPLWTMCSARCAGRPHGGPCLPRSPLIDEALLPPCTPDCGVLFLAKRTAESGWRQALTVSPYALRAAQGIFHCNLCVLAVHSPCLCCRREGNRKAAARLRMRRQAEVQALQSRVQQYEQEASPYTSAQPGQPAVAWSPGQFVECLLGFVRPAAACSRLRSAHGTDQRVSMMHGRRYGVGILLHILTFPCRLSQLTHCVRSMSTLLHIACTA